MSKTLEINISNFSGGISDDSRENNGTKFQTAKHFDVFSNPTRLTPYRSLETDTNDGSTATGMKQYFVQDYVYASASAKLYGLGQTAAGLTQLFFKADATSGNWTVSTVGTGAVKNGCLVEYKDYLWGFQGTTSVFKWGLLSGAPAITNAAGTVGTITSVAQGIIAKDDNLYLPYNNKLARVTSGGTVNDAVLTLPTNFKITSICNYGNYLAIGCAPISTFNGTSKVFLWNLTGVDVQEAIDWGEGELRVLETIEGYLVGVTDRYLNNATGAGRGSMIIQIYSGGVPQVVKEVFTQALTGKSIPLQKTVKNNRLFWAAKIMTNSAGTIHNEGIWSFGRKNVNFPFALNLDIIDENFINNSGIQSFGTAANYFFISHSGDGSISKTNDAATYAEASVYTTQIFSFGDPTILKQLKSVSVSTVALPAGAAVQVYYTADASAGTMGTSNTVNSRTTTHLNLGDSSGSAFPAAYEYSFTLESTGGAEITGIKIIASQLSDPTT